MSISIIIDDTDSGIAYKGSWFADRGSQDGLGNFGPPYLSTLHGTTSDASFSYTFQGTVISITGTQQYENSSVVTNPGPSWQCFIDNESIPAKTYSYANNRLELCDQEGLIDGTHTITVKTQITGGRTFWFDYLTYLPSASVPLDNAALSIGVPQAQMQFGTGWDSYYPGNKTSTPGSTFSYDFNGISLIWLGFYDAQLPFAATNATYTIDSGAPTTFNLNGVTATTTGVQYNQIFFETPALPAGLHTLEVTYQGNNLTTPLALETIIVQNGPSSGSSTASTSAVSPATSSSNSPPSNPSQGSHLSHLSHSTSHVGAIVGGVVGALAMIVVAIRMFLVLRRREKLSRQKGVVQDMRTIDPGPTAPHSVGGVSPYPSPHNENLFLGNPVVGKRNIASMSPAGQVGQHSNVPGTRTSGYYTSAGMHAQNASISTTKMSENVSNSTGPPTYATRFEPTAGSPTTSPITGTAEISRPRVIRDEDSGIRMGQTADGEVVVLPPAYTAS